MYIYDAIKSINEKKVAGFHMPGHNGGQIFKDLGYDDVIKDLIKCDITEIPGADNLHSPEDAILKSQEEIARIMGAKYSYILVNGTTSGIEAIMSTILGPNDAVIINRGAHQSIINGLKMTGSAHFYVDPRDVRGLGEMLETTPGIKAAIFTYPTYFGTAIDLKRICDICHEKGVIVIVDEAHGSHLGLSDELPKNAIELGADVSVESLHKTLPAFTQVSVLHLANDDIDRDRLSECLKIFESSSPSYMLMIGAEMAVDIYDKYGKDLMDNLLNNIDRFISAIAKTPFKIYQGDDKTRLFISTEKLGIGGEILERELIENYGIYVELSNQNGILMLTTISNTRKEFTKMINALTELAAKYGPEMNLAGKLVNVIKRIARGSKVASTSYENAFEPRIIASRSVVSANKGNEDRKKESTKEESIAEKTGIVGTRIRDAFFGNYTEVELNQSIGHISAETITPYPPGIPIITAGELINEEHIKYIEQALARSTKIFGIIEGDAKIYIRILS